MRRSSLSRRGRSLFSATILFAGAISLAACNSSSTTVPSTNDQATSDACYSNATKAVTVLLQDTANNNASALSADSVALGRKYGTQSQTWKTVLNAVASVSGSVGHIPLAELLDTSQLSIRMGCAAPGTTVTTISPATEPPQTTTSPQASTTAPPTTAASRETVTYGSTNGPIVWQSGDPIPTRPNGTEAGYQAYEGYYCTHPPFPDGMDRSGSAGCSGMQGQGGYFLNHVS
jgi:hypothetical protein